MRREPMATQYKAEYDGTISPKPHKIFNTLGRYAKSGRSSCKKCGKSISDGALRMGPLVQSPHFDGKVPLWHHFECCASKAAALVDAAQVDGYFSLRPEHQSQIDTLIASNLKPSSAAKAEDKKAVKASKDLSDVPGEINVEAAKSGRSSCRKCFESIAQGTLCIVGPSYFCNTLSRDAPHRANGLNRAQWPAISRHAMDARRLFLLRGFCISSRDERRSIPALRPQKRTRHFLEKSQQGVRKLLALLFLRRPALRRRRPSAQIR